MLLEVARIFSARKGIELPLLNRVGLQIGRILLARLLGEMRLGKVSEAYRHELARLHRDGCLVREDFLPDALFSELRSEIYAIMQDPKRERARHDHGAAHLEQWPLMGQDDPSAALCALFDDPFLNQIISAVEGRRVDMRKGHRVAERLTQTGEGDDRESHLHVDTFFATHKLWLYLDDVNAEQGPLVFYPGSHRLSLNTLGNAYRDSVAQHGRGSRRISDEECSRSGLNRKTMLCKKNTLVIANTAGYHCRDQGVRGSERRAIQFSFRFNPYLPVGIDAESLGKRLKKYLGRR